MFDFMQHMTNPRTMSNDLESFKTYVESDPELVMYRPCTIHIRWICRFYQTRNDEVYQVELWM